jgi:hypothetical protein
VALGKNTLPLPALLAPESSLPLDLGHSASRLGADNSDGEEVVSYAFRISVPSGGGQLADGRQSAHGHDLPDGHEQTGNAT